MFKSIKLEMTAALIESSKVRVWIKDGELHYSKDQFGHGIESIKDEISSISAEDFCKKIENLNIPVWKKDYQPVGVVIMDGVSWSVKYETDTGNPVKSGGDNAFPSNWKSLIKLLQSVAGDFETFED